MKIRVSLISLLAAHLIYFSAHAQKTGQDINSIDLSGAWSFQIDSSDEGKAGKWYDKKPGDQISLPGSMTTNNKGYDISLTTPWTGSIVDSSWFTSAVYAPYRKPGNIKIPFWLQPVKYYKGPAWYQKTVNVPSSWKGKYIELFLERLHWQSKVWVDGQAIGSRNSLATPHIYDLTQSLKPGTHTLTIRIDNRVLDVNVGPNSHSISDHTQTNWNGMIGKMFLAARSPVYINDVQVYPDIKNKQVKVRVALNNMTGRSTMVDINIYAILNKKDGSRLPGIRRQIEVKDSLSVELPYSMGNSPLLWDEFHPNTYNLHVKITDSNQNIDRKTTAFGMRSFSTEGTQFTINGRKTFLRGTLECAIFPKTGFPPTNVDAWLHIFKICRSYGLNHMRFHSWCPPEAAFTAADQTGFYLQIEIDSWANQGSSVGDGAPIDQYIYDESNRIVKAYGNHPSFCMMAYGNEPAGENLKTYLTGFVNYWKNKDPRRLYTTAAGWPVVPENNYNSSPDPRIQGWGEGLKSIINREAPRTDYDWSGIISKWEHPTVSHEIGQWCVYPDLKEIKKYTGVLKAKNFEIFRDMLAQNGLEKLSDSFLLASGKLQALCYKADIEAALRTPGFGGFQLLDLHDFPGQGTALVGVLNPFWEDKGYITGKEYSRFCNSLVPLVRLPKMVFQNDEALNLPVEVANFGETPLQHIQAGWKIENDQGRILFQGSFPAAYIPIGNGIKIGEIRNSLSSLHTACKLTLTVDIANQQNSWEIFVYPKTLPEVHGILVTQNLDENALATLAAGGKVLLTPKKGSIRAGWGGNIQIGFSSIFWNTVWTHSQPPTTLGILCNPDHPALKHFPTEYYSNYQWWDAMSHSNAIRLDSVAAGLQPIVRVIDDWVTANSLGLIFECKTGQGTLLVSGIDLLTGQEKRPEAKQLLYSLEKYMSGPAFRPAQNVGIERIREMLN